MHTFFFGELFKVNDRLHITPADCSMYILKLFHRHHVQGTYHFWRVLNNPFPIPLLSTSISFMDFTITGHDDGEGGVRLTQNSIEDWLHLLKYHPWTLSTPWVTSGQDHYWLPCYPTPSPLFTCLAVGSISTWLNTAFSTLLSYFQDTISASLL